METNIEQEIPTVSGNNTQETSNPQENAEQTILPKSELIQEKKRKFFRKAKLIGLSIIAVFALTLVLLTGRSLYIKNKDNFTVNPDETKNGDGDIVITTTETIEEEDKNELYFNDRFRFSFEYPKTAILDVQDADEETYSASVISEEAIPIKDPNGFNLIKGYIVTVNPIAVAARDIAKVAEIKREWFKENCPSTAVFSNISDTKISNINGNKFDISKCTSEFVVSYIPANNFIYEIIQVYKGDIGYIQNYKAETTALVNSIKIYEDKPELDPIIKYDGRGFGLAFEYARELDTACCTVPEPPVDNRYVNLITLSAGGNEKAIGFFAVTTVKEPDFEIYANKFENVLRDDYKVIKGRSPQEERKEIILGGQKAYKFEGFSWKGNNLILAKLSGDNRYLVISYTDYPEEMLTSILNSVLITIKQ